MTSAKSKPGFGVLVLAIVLAGCQASPFPPAANPPAQADSPRLAVGDAWVYRHTDGYTKLPRGTFAHTISAIAGDVVTVQVTAENGSIVATDQFTRDWNWLDKPMTNIQRFRYAPPYQAFQFPLKTDSKWSVQMKATDVTKSKIYELARVDGKAVGWQRVAVPAGAFDSMLVHRAAYSGVETFERTQEYITEDDWYAPAVNNVVFGSYRSLYRDKTQNGDMDDGWRNGDWMLVELLEYRPARR
ncbi:MAG TPA: hypothetical protein VGQ54_16755 [Burkholderiales bacterium]|jgi:hypothetical protein|nr:hypothetical protein [Burkholderiales bacterium]